MHVIGRYKAYSPVVFTVLLLIGMLLILIFENFGLARKEQNISMRLANPIQMAQLNIEKRQIKKTSGVIKMKNTESEIKDLTIKEVSNEKVEKIINILSDSLEEFNEEDDVRFTTHE